MQNLTRGHSHSAKKQKQKKLAFKIKIPSQTHSLKHIHTLKVLQPTTALFIYKAILNKIQINCFVPCMEIFCVLVFYR